MSFRSMAASRTAATLSRLGGEAATYRAQDGSSYTVSVLVEDSVDVVDESGQLIERVRAGTLARAQLSAAPKMGDTLTVGARVYVVQRLLSDDGYAVQVSLS